MKVIFLETPSTKKNFLSELNIAKTNPGKPAPVPTSSILVASLMYSLTLKLSKKCFMTISLSDEIAVKLNTLFHFFNASR